MGSGMGRPIGTMISDMTVKGGKSPLFGSPKDFGLAFKDVEFSALDGVRLRGWLVPGSSDKVVIQSHFGLQCCRSGFTPEGKGRSPMWPKDIHFLNQAKYLNQQGYTVLMYDFRNHGESDAGKKEWATWGIEESKDVVAAVEYISSHADYQNSKIGLLSICMGGNATLFALGNQALQKYSNIKALVVIQPLLYTILMKKAGFPSWLADLAVPVTEERTGINFNETFVPEKVLPLVEKVPWPTLVVQNRNDPLTDLSYVESYYERLQVEKKMYWQSLEKNRFASYQAMGEQEHMEQIYPWFSQHM